MPEIVPAKNPAEQLLMLKWLIYQMDIGLRLKDLQSADV